MGVWLSQLLLRIKDKFKVLFMMSHQQVILYILNLQ